MTDARGVIATNRMTGEGSNALPARVQGDLAVPCTCREDLLPTYASSDAAGADLRADLSGPVIISAGSREIIPTGVRCAIPGGFEAQIRPRSGLAARHGITLLNSPGTIDADYRGEIQVILVNLGQEPYTVQPGDRIAQMVIAPVTRALFEIGDLSTSARGSNGFGSTGR